jgi:hypothetical protein
LVGVHVGGGFFLPVGSLFAIVKPLMASLREMNGANIGRRTGYADRETCLITKKMHVFTMFSSAFAAAKDVAFPTRSIWAFMPTEHKGTPYKCPYVQKRMEILLGESYQS